MSVWKQQMLNIRQYQHFLNNYPGAATESYWTRLKVDYTLLELTRCIHVYPNNNQG